MNLLESCIEYPNIKIINLGSSCIYPLEADNPIKEIEFMNGKLEPTNSPYAMAKLTSIEIGRALSSQFGHKVINLMPTNLYGPNDFYHETEGHVIPSLIYKMHKAKENNEPTFSIWGSGNPKREFLYVDDLAKASICVMNLDKKIYDQHISPMSSHINVGSGKDISIKDLANLIKEVVGFKGRIEFDKSKPDGVQRKLIDSSLMEIFGFTANTNLKDGLALSYIDFLKKC